ncbi:hypothetical protein PoB_000509800 [Plakobranchus ocellatus]|uniref:PiggyBac transposable element-derived protein domain-containing protein n=1 Tax=Plakobranchus ocellatus TaxID=259542 RepID=A0AAV3Y8V0_9GAST|nr:hypothetical protein PoB_000509800 [Plakobranchus ocellatus]
MDPDRSRPSQSGDAFLPIFSDLDVRDLINNDPDSEEDDFDSGESDVDENHGYTLNDLMRESIEEPIENIVLDLESSPSSSDRPNDQVYEDENNVYISRSSSSSSSTSRNDQAEVVDRRIVRGWVRGRSRRRGPRTREGPGQRRGMDQKRSNLVENWEVDGPDAPNDIPFIGEPGISAETENFTPTNYFELFFNEDLLNHIAKQTKLYATQYLEFHQTLHNIHEQVYGWIRMYKK